MNNHLVQSIKLNAQGTFLGKRFLPLNPEQIRIEETWDQYLDETLGPEMQPEELEALERALKKIQILKGNNAHKETA